MFNHYTPSRVAEHVSFLACQVKSHIRSEPLPSRDSIKKAVAKCMSEGHYRLPGVGTFVYKDNTIEISGAINRTYRLINTED